MNRALFLTAAVATLPAAVIAVVLAISPACTHQLTVEEAEASLTLSCAVLAQTLTQARATPTDSKLVKRAVAQACQPGRTRALLARLLSKEPPATTEYLEFLDADPSGLARPPAAPPITQTDAGGG